MVVDWKETLLSDYHFGLEVPFDVRVAFRHAGVVEGKRTSLYNVRWAGEKMGEAWMVTLDPQYPPMFHKPIERLDFSCAHDRAAVLVDLPPLWALLVPVPFQVSILLDWPFLPSLSTIRFAPLHLGVQSAWSPACPELSTSHLGRISLSTALTSGESIGSPATSLNPAMLTKKSTATPVFGDFEPSTLVSHTSYG